MSCRLMQTTGEHEGSPIRAGAWVGEGLVPCLCWCWERLMQVTVGGMGLDMGLGVGEEEQWRGQHLPVLVGAGRLRM